MKISMKIQIVNGPNLNLLGTREPEIYGYRTFEEFLEELQKDFPNDEIGFFQSNVEGELINCMQTIDGKCDGIVLNAGGYSHTSVAIHDCIIAMKTPIVEVHISNIYAREKYRQKSLLSSACHGVICGFGLDSYKLAIYAFKS